MAAVMIGAGPHKASHTAVAISAAEEPLGELRVRASVAQAGRPAGLGCGVAAADLGGPGAPAGRVTCWPGSWWRPVSGCWMFSPSPARGSGCWPPGT